MSDHAFTIIGKILSIWCNGAKKKGKWLQFFTIWQCLIVLVQNKKAVPDCSQPLTNSFHSLSILRACLAWVRHCLGSGNIFNKREKIFYLPDFVFVKVGSHVHMHRCVSVCVCSRMCFKDANTAWFSMTHCRGKQCFKFWKKNNINNV